jgi:parallel beta-helix repeat protein
LASNKLKETLSPEDFGAVGDGVADDTAAITLCIAAASAAYKGINFSQKTYLVKKILILPNIPFVNGNGATINHDGDVAVTEVIGVCGSEWDPANIVSNLKLSGFTINTASIRVGIMLWGSNANVLVENNVINTVGLNKGGIYLQKTCNNCRVHNNTVICNIPADPNTVLPGIMLNNQVDDGYGYYYANSGVNAAPTTPVYNNVVSNNYVANGVHGIAMLGCQNNLITGNILYNQAARSIICGNSSWHNTITGNKCMDFGSSGIHLQILWRDRPAPRRPRLPAGPG